MKKFLLVLFILFSCTNVWAAGTGTKLKTIPVSKEMKSYISSKFKPVKNKKLVLYAGPALKVPGCKHSAFFAKIVNSLRQNKNATASYSFRSFDLNQMAKGSITAMEKTAAFADFCGSFCVVSMENNWAYAPLGSSYRIEQTALLPAALAELKSKP